jgi:hypothetical protein
LRGVAAAFFGLWALYRRKGPTPKPHSNHIEKPYYFGFVLKVAQLQIAA